MKMQAHPAKCEEVAGCAYTYASCGAAAAGTCGSASQHENRTACLETSGCTHSAVESCSAPVFGACAGASGCMYVAGSGGSADACVPVPGNCTYEAVQCDGADMQAGQDACEADEACVWSLGFCGAEAVCLGTEWPEELSDVLDANVDAERQTLCESTSGCFYTNRLAVIHLVEASCILLFTFEYFLKLVSCTARPEKPLDENGQPRNPVVETLSWATETLNAVDLVAILPWWASLLSGDNFDVGSPILRMLRMVRVFRILKIGGHVRNLQLFVIGMRRAREGLMLLLFLLILYLCVFAAILYQLEYDDQREAGNTGFTSIPTTWYFIMATMTTVGYGDHYPITPAGQLVGGLCMITGIFVLGLPIVTVGSSFDEVFKEDEEETLRAKEAAKRLEQQLSGEVENPLSKGAASGTQWSATSTMSEEQQEPSFNVDVALHCEMRRTQLCCICHSSAYLCLTASLRQLRVQRWQSSWKACTQRQETIVLTQLSIGW